MPGHRSTAAGVVRAWGMAGRQDDHYRIFLSLVGARPQTRHARGQLPKFRADPGRTVVEKQLGQTDAPEPQSQGGGMRRYRRLVVIDRVIPFLAALVGLVALAGAVVVQVNADAKAQANSAAVAELRAAVEALAAAPQAGTILPDDGTAEALLSLQDRMNAMEAAWTEQAAALATAPAIPADATASAEIDPSLPTTDCIPLGTRFMVIPNDTFPLCQSRAVLRTGIITDDTVSFEGVGTIVETGFGAIPETTCTVMVFSADSAGFGEVRVTCT